MSTTADERTIVSPVNVEKRQEVDVQTGDTVRVIEKMPDGDDYRLQPFEGIVLARKHGNEAGATFTVRQEVEGVGVEKIFPLYSPRIDEIQVVRRARTRRSKLYHIRDKAARQIRREMRRMINVDLSTKTEAESPNGDEVPTSNEDESVGEVPADEAEEVDRASNEGGASGASSQEEPEPDSAKDDSEEPGEVGDQEEN